MPRNSEIHPAAVTYAASPQHCIGQQLQLLRFDCNVAEREATDQDAFSPASRRVLLLPINDAPLGNVPPLPLLLLLPRRLFVVRS